MIGYSLMMCFVGIVLCIMAILLLRGNTGGIHGKVYKTTIDKVGYGKALGKVVLFIAIGILASGGTALLGSAADGIRNLLIILAAVIGLSAYFFIKIQKRFGNSRTGR